MIPFKQKCELRLLKVRGTVKNAAVRVCRWFFLLAAFVFQVPATLFPTWWLKEVAENVDFLWGHDESILPLRYRQKVLLLSSEYLSRTEPW